MKPAASRPRTEPLRRATILVAGLIGAAVVLGATGVGLLVGCAWSLLFLSGCAALIAVVIARGMTAGG